MDNPRYEVIRTLLEDHFQESTKFEVIENVVFFTFFENGATIGISTDEIGQRSMLEVGAKIVSSLTLHEEVGE